MDFSQHVSLSLPVAAGLSLATGRWEAGLAFAVGGVLVDLDHLPDYYMEKGVTFSLAQLNAHFAEHQARRLVLVMHAWEWNALTWAAWALFGLPLWVAAFAAGWLAHLILDQRYNLLQPWAYWFFARYRIGFQAAPLHLPWDLKSPPHEDSPSQP
jgi:hypothetical protein